MDSNKKLNRRTILYSTEEFLKLISEYSMVKLNTTKGEKMTFINDYSFEENFFSLSEQNNYTNLFIFHNPHNIRYLKSLGIFLFKARLNNSLYAGEEFMITIYKITEFRPA